MTREQRDAWETLGVTETTWEEDTALRSIIAKVTSKTWSELTEEERESAGLLEWTEESWSAAGLVEKHWDELAERQRHWATELGFSETEWGSASMPEVVIEPWSQLTVEHQQTAAKLGLTKLMWDLTFGARQEVPIRLSLDAYQDEAALWAAGGWVPYTLEHYDKGWGRQWHAIYGKVAFNGKEGLRFKEIEPDGIIERWNEKALPYEKVFVHDVIVKIERTEPYATSATTSREMDKLMKEPGTLRLTILHDAEARPPIGVRVRKPQDEPLGVEMFPERDGSGLRITRIEKGGIFDRYLQEHVEFTGQVMLVNDTIVMVTRLDPSVYRCSSDPLEMQELLKSFGELDILVERTAPRPFNCIPNVNNLPYEWECRKRRYCRATPAPTPAPTRATPAPTPAPPPAPDFDCSAGLSKFESGWSLEKKVFCCKNESWRTDRKEWCCRERHIGCEEPGSLESGTIEVCFMKNGASDFCSKYQGAVELSMQKLFGYASVKLTPAHTAPGPSSTARCDMTATCHGACPKSVAPKDGKFKEELRKALEEQCTDTSDDCSTYDWEEWNCPEANARGDCPVDKSGHRDYCSIDVNKACCKCGGGSRPQTSVQGAEMCIGAGCSVRSCAVRTSEAVLRQGHSEPTPLLHWILLACTLLLCLALCIMACCLAWCFSNRKSEAKDNVPLLVTQKVAAGPPPQPARLLEPVAMPVVRPTEPTAAAPITFQPQQQLPMYQAAQQPYEPVASQRVQRQPVVSQLLETRRVAVGEVFFTTQSSMAGQSEIEVASLDAFAVGDVVMISGNGHTETRVVTGCFGALRLDKPLTYSYSIGAVVNRARFSEHYGCLVSGDDLVGGGMVMSIEEAKAWCVQNPTCVGFTCNMRTGQVYFKTAWSFREEPGWMSYRAERPEAQDRVTAASPVESSLSVRPAREVLHTYPVQDYTASRGASVYPY